MIADLVFGEDPFPGSQVAAFPYILPWWRTGRKSELFSVSSYKDANAVRRAPLSGPKYLPRSLPLSTITLGVRVSTYIF